MHGYMQVKKGCDMSTWQERRWRSCYWVQNEGFRKPMLVLASVRWTSRSILCAVVSLIYSFTENLRARRYPLTHDLRVSLLHTRN